jgi:glycosyltransferase involved in cell wall biosynthesis
MKMNITLIGPVYPFRGGIAHYTTVLAAKLSDTGNEIQVISFKRLYPTWFYPGKTDRDPSRDPLKVDALFLLDPYNPLTWDKTINAIGLYKPEIVIMQWWVTLLAPAYAYVASRLRKKGFQIAYLIHNVMPHEPRFWDKFLARLALSQGSKFIVQTLKEKDRLLELLPGKNVVVSPHPAYDIFAVQKIPKTEARHLLGLDVQTPIALFFGFVRPYKGLKYLLEVIARLKAIGSDVQLVIAGEFWEDITIYKQHIAALGIEDRIRIENRYISNEEIGLFFSAADIFIAPYIGGTQSGAVRIALGFNMPSIVGVEIADEDLIKNYPEMVKIVQPKDLVQFTDAVTEILLKQKHNLQNGHEISPTPMPDHWGKLIEAIQNPV